jgi:hypothetical protein
VIHKGDAPKASRRQKHRENTIKQLIFFGTLLTKFHRREVLLGFSLFLHGEPNAWVSRGKDYTGEH